MHLGIAIYLARRRLEDPRFDSFGETEHVDRTVHACFRGLYGIALVMDWGSRTGEVVDLVHFDVKRKRNVVAEQLEMLVRKQWRDIVLGANEKIFDADHVVATSEKKSAQLR